MEQANWKIIQISIQKSNILKWISFLLVVLGVRGYMMHIIVLQKELHANFEKSTIILH